MSSLPRAMCYLFLVKLRARVQVCLFFFCICDIYTSNKKWVSFYADDGDDDSQHASSSYAHIYYINALCSFQFWSIFNIWSFDQKMHNLRNSASNGIWNERILQCYRVFFSVCARVLIQYKIYIKTLRVEM